MRIFWKFGCLALNRLAIKWNLGTGKLVLTGWLQQLLNKVWSDSVFTAILFFTVALLMVSCIRVPLYLCHCWTASWLFHSCPLQMLTISVLLLQFLLFFHPVSSSPLSKVNSLLKICRFVFILIKWKLRGVRNNYSALLCLSTNENMFNITLKKAFVVTVVVANTH